MYTLIILLILCLVEFTIIFWKWDEFQDYKEIAAGIASITKVDKNKHYSNFVKTVGWVIIKFKFLLIVPVIILFIANLIVSSILGTILHFIF